MLAFSGSRLRFTRQALWRAWRARPRLVVVGHANFAPLALALGALRPRPGIWIVTHGVEVWKRLGMSQRAALARADLVTAVSQFTAQRLAAVNGLDRPIPLLPCALDPDWSEQESATRSVPAESQVRPTLLTVSRLETGDRYKGVDTVIKALPRIAVSIPQIRYVVVGDGSDRPWLQSLARDLGVTGRVEFRGRLPTSALAREYSACSAFVMPSAGEGFGIVFLEAAFFGKPSLAGDHGGSPEVVADGITGFVVPPGDEAALAEAAVKLLSAPETLLRMGQAARRRLLERFTYDAFAARLAHLVAPYLGE